MSDNDNLELKKRSRRRLVGAAALALIAAIVLPMVMDPEPVMPQTDIQVTIPERTVDARPIGGREAVIEPVPDLLSDDAAPAAEAEEALRPLGPDVSTVSEPAGATSRAAPDSGTAQRQPTESKPETKPGPAPTAEPEDSAEARRARAILEGRATQAQTEAARFMVQAGAFSDEVKARAHQRDLAAKGFQSFIENSEGVSRVRMGPFGSRTEAEAMIGRLRGASFDGVVIAR